MKKEWADKWIIALRSGEYQQGKGRLRTLKGGFCVLGVLCHIAGEVPTPGHEHSELGTVYLYGPEAESAVLPERVMMKTGMHSNRGYMSDKSMGVLSLSAMNDGGQSFGTMASFIEANWEQL